MGKVLKKLPDSEELQLTICTRSGEAMFYVTKKNTTGMFCIYKTSIGGVEFLGKGSSPIELESRFNTRFAIENVV